MTLIQSTVFGDAMELTKLAFNAKDGIDNPAMVIGEDTEKVSGPSPRVCVLRRTAAESFDFHLNRERGRPGHVIRHVEMMGVAMKSGLKDGDRVLEVNELFVDDLEHMEVVRRIQRSGAQLCLLVIGGEEYEQIVAQGWDLKELCKTQRGEDWKRPRLCHITKDRGAGLGLSIQPVKGEKGKFAMSPVAGGPAEQAGVRKGDRLVWICGATASELTHSAIKKMVKKCSDHMTVLVIDSDSEKSYTRRKVPILPVMADAQSMPYKPRRLHLAHGPDGCGFLLRKEMISAGRKVHMVGEVEAGSPAELAGLKNDEILLEVNGESTDHLNHDDIVSKARDSGNQVSFTTMTLQGHNFYTKLGLSPLLFCEDPSPQDRSPAAVKLPLVQAKEEPQLESKPRLCVIQRGPLGFGFHLGCVQQKPGTFIQQVVAGGPGESSGLLQGDVLMEVNGQNVEEEHLEDVLLLMKKGGDSLSLLVLDRPGYERKEKKEKSAETAVKTSEVQEQESQKSSRSSSSSSSSGSICDNSSGKSQTPAD